MKYLLTIRYGGYHHIRPSNIECEQHAIETRDFVQAQLDQVRNRRKGPSKGAKPIVTVWKQIEVEVENSPST